MKREIPMTNGDEYDALTRWHHYLHWKPGERKSIKRKFNKRSRLKSRLKLRKRLENINGDNT